MEHCSVAALACAIACFALPSHASSQPAPNEPAQSTTEDRVFSLLAEADRLVELKQRDEARRLCDEALQLAPDDPIALCKRAALCGVGTRDQEAELSRRAAKIFVQRLRATPRDPALRATILRLAAASGADALCKALIEVDPDDVDALFLLARAGSDDEPARIAFLAHALDLLEASTAPNHAAVARARAWRELEECQRLGGLALEVAICERMLSWNPDDVDVLVWRSGLHERLGGGDFGVIPGVEGIEELSFEEKEALIYERKLADLLRAVAVLDAELAVHPSSVAALKKRIAIHEDERERLASADKLVEVAPNDAESWFIRGRLLGWGAIPGSERFDGALRDFSKAIELDADHVGARFARADLHAQRGDREAQISDLSHLIDLGPADIRPYESRAYAQRALAMERKDPALDRKALADLLIALHMPSASFDSAGARENFERLLTDILWDFRRRQDFDAAIALCTELIESEPTMASLYVERAQLHVDHPSFRSSPVHRAQAVADLARAAALKPGDPQLIDRWWDAYDIENRKLPDDLPILVSALDDASLLLRAQTKPEGAIRWHLVRGRILAKLERESEALLDLDRAVELAPGIAGPWIARARTHRELEHWDQAIADFGRAIELDPKNVRLLLDRAAVHAASARYVEAIADCEAALGLEPGAEEIQRKLNQLRTSIGDWDGIIASATQRIAADPRQWKLYVERAQAHERKGERERALADFGLAVDAAEGSARVEALLTRAEVLEAWGELGRAFEDWDLIVSSSDFFPEVRLKRARALVRRGEHARAIADFDRLVERSPRDVTLWIDRAECHMALGNGERARADYDRAVEVEPKSARAWAGRARWLQSQGDTARALAEFRRARAIDFDDLDALSGLDAIYTRRGIKDWKAIELDAWIAEGPPSVEAHYERAIQRMDAKDTDGAVADLNAALDLAPDDLKCLNYRLVVHSVRRNYDSALDDANRVVELAPQDPDSWKARARVHWDLGRHEQAMQDYERAVAVAPERSSARIEMEARRPAVVRAKVADLKTRAAELLRNQDWSGGIALIEQALRLDPGNEQLLCSRASGVLGSGDAAKAASLFDEILAAHPDSSNARFGRAQARFVLGGAASAQQAVVGTPCYRCGGKGRITVEHSSLNAYRDRDTGLSFQWDSTTTEERCPTCLGTGI